MRSFIKICLICIIGINRLKEKFHKKNPEYMLNYSLPRSIDKRWQLYPAFYLSFFPFLAHLAKGHVSFCHHLASVIRHKLSHLNLLLWNRWTKLSSFELVLKQQWTIGEISIFSNSSHLEWRAGLSDTILKGTHPGTIPARFGFNIFWVFLWDFFSQFIPFRNIMR
jgi:hypothetical protein